MDPTTAQAPETEPPPRRPWILRTLLIGALVLVAAVLLFRPVSEPSDAALPAFDLPGLMGDEGLSNADLAGDVAVLNFWASWCEPCRKESPMLDDISERYADRGVTVVGVDVQDVALAAQDFVKEYNLGYTMVQDLEQDLYRALRELAGARDGLPQTYFVTAAGEVVLKGPAAPVLGEISEAELTEALDHLLERR